MKKSLLLLLFLLIYPQQHINIPLHNHRTIKENFQYIIKDMAAFKPMAGRKAVPLMTLASLFASWLYLQKLVQDRDKQLLQLMKSF